MKACTRQPKATATMTNCPTDKVRAVDIITGLLRAAPMMGSTPWMRARNKATMSAKLPISGIMLRLSKLFGYGILCSAAARLRRRSFGSFGFLQGIGGFGRHVIFVMLGEHLIGVEHVVGFQLALGNHALPLLEQVGKNALVDHRHGLGRIGDVEAHRQTVLLALHAAGLDQPADTETAALRRFLVVNLGRGEIQADVVLQREQHQSNRRCNQRDTRHDEPQSFLPRRHASSPVSSVPISSRITRSSRSVFFLRWRTIAISMANTSSATPYEPQT